MSLVENLSGQFKSIQFDISLAQVLDNLKRSKAVEEV
jgi:hypothetical protein